MRKLMDNSNRINDIYGYIHFKLKENCNGTKEKSYHELVSQLSYIRISKKIIPKLIKELEKRKIINKVGKLSFEINNYPLSMKKIEN